MPSPDEWGSNAWALLQDLALKTDILLAKLCKNPQASKLVMETLCLKIITIFRKLRYCLPCYMCRQHYTQYLSSKMPLETFFSVKSLCKFDQKVGANGSMQNYPVSRFVFGLHNHVNKETKKKQYPENEYLKQLNNRMFMNPLTKGKAISLLHAISSDDICNPGSKESKDQLKAGFGLFARMKTNECIGGQTFQEFGGAIAHMYFMFAQYNLCEEMKQHNSAVVCQDNEMFELFNQYTYPN